MKQLFIISLAVSLLSFAKASAQEATVTFTADKDCEMLVYKPIDGGHNKKIPADTLTVQSGKAARFTSEVSPYTFIFCKIPQYRRNFDVLLFPDDSLQVDVNAQGVTFRGSNQEAQQYYFDNLQKEPFLKKAKKIQNILQEYLDEKRTMGSILPSVDDSLQISAQLKEIEQLPQHGDTRTTFATVLKREASLYYNSFFVMMFRNAISEKQENGSLIETDSIQARKIVGDILEQNPFSYELMKYPSFGLYQGNYLTHYHGKGSCPDGYDAETFGPYGKYLFAPVEMHPALLGRACLVQLEYDSGEMNLAKLKQFFNERFPDSEYTAIINQRMTDEPEADFTDAHFVSEPIESLSDLCKLPALQGKYLYIDLWASWCMPCRGEFSHKEKVEEILSAHGNIATVYVSIDKEEQEKAWRNCINRYKLKGYHLMASEALVRNIQKEIYGTDKIGIPRYVLLSPSGEILNNDLPRPSNYPQLKEAIDGLVMKK